MLIRTAIIRQVGSRWCVFSKKKNPKTGKRRRMGCYGSRSGASKRIRQIEFFKRKGFLIYKKALFVLSTH